MNLAKAGVLLIWALIIGAFFYPAESTAVMVLRAAGGFLVVAHGIEVAVFWRVLKKAPGSLTGHIVSTLLYGVFHVGALKKAQRTASPSS